MTKKSENKTFNRNLLYVPIIYTLTMAIAWLLNPHPYGELDNVLFIIPFLILLSMFSISLVLKNKIMLFRQPLKFTIVLGVFIIMLIYLLLSNFLAYLDGDRFGSLQDTLLLLFATLLVGIAEEFTFRGYLLNGLAKQVGLRKAVVFSSIMFGLMHSVNFLAGPSIAATIFQVVLTTVVGYAFAIIYIKTNFNLILVAILHGLYDFLLFNFSHLVKINESTRNTVFIFPLIILIWIVSLKAAKNIYTRPEKTTIMNV